MFKLTATGFSVPNADEKDKNGTIISKEVIQAGYLYNLKREIEVCGRMAIVTGVRIDDESIHVSLHYLVKEEI